VVNGVSSPCSTTGNTLQRRRLSLLNPSQGQYFGELHLLDDGGTANYNGLLLSLQHRLARNFTVLGNYTWSHCISDLVTTELSGPSYSDPDNRRADRGNCRFTDARQMFNLSVVAYAPKFSGRLMQAVAGNWQVSVIASAKTGGYFSAITGIDHGLTGLAQQRPNQVLADPYCANRNQDCWLNPAAFAAPPPGQNGNLGANNLLGPGMFQVDLALSRTFNVGEGKTFQLRAEAFNLANHMNPANPGVCTNGTCVNALNNLQAFGKIQSDISGNSGLSAGDPRIMQFAVKYVF